MASKYEWMLKCTKVLMTVSDGYFSSLQQFESSKAENHHLWLNYHLWLNSTNSHSCYICYFCFYKQPFMAVLNSFTTHHLNTTQIDKYQYPVISFIHKLSKINNRYSTNIKHTPQHSHFSLTAVEQTERNEYLWEASRGDCLVWLKVDNRLFQDEQADNIHIVGQSMNKPIFSFYYLNQGTYSSKDLDEVRSNATQRTSYLSSRSPPSTKLLFARKDQIQPTRPIIPKSPKPLTHKHSTEPQLPKPTLTLQAEEIEEPEEPKQNGGFLSWKVMGNFCGVSDKKESACGCVCESPCKYRSEWSKQIRPKDKLTYAKLRELPPAPPNETQINKDIHRTYPHNPTFSKNNKFRIMLKEVLLTYSVYDPELGYVQGVNLIAAILLYHIKTAEETFWALVELMEQQQLRMIYLGKLEHLRFRCSNIDQLLAKQEPTLHAHMLRVGVASSCFLDGWLLSLMSKIVPLEHMHLVIDNFRNSGWHFLYSLVLCFLKALRDYLLITQDEPEFLMTLSQQNWKESGIDWLKIIGEAKQHLLR